MKVPLAPYHGTDGIMAGVNLIVNPSGDTSMTGMTIGKVAHAAGVGVETVRYYERQGLVARPAREEGAYRLYPLRR